MVGRIIARATGRDSGARLGDGVVLLSGQFSSGGSVRNWKTTWKAETTIMLRDVPEPVSDGICDGWEIVSSDPQLPVVDRDVLIAEKERLSSRISEIDAVLVAS